MSRSRTNIEAMLKHARKRMQQRAGKPLAKHARETMTNTKNTSQAELTHSCANCSTAYQGTGCPVCRLAAPAASAPPSAAITLILARTLGLHGAAFDPPGRHRAYTYQHQPGNGAAYRLGIACDKAAAGRAGDLIDRGLGLLKELQEVGYGVFDVADSAGPVSGMEDDDLIDLGGTAPRVPAWLVKDAARISDYMAAHHPGAWAIGGIQRRTGAAASADPAGHASCDSSVALMRVNLAEGTPVYATAMNAPVAGEAMELVTPHDWAGSGEEYAAAVERGDIRAFHRVGPVVATPQASADAGITASDVHNAAQEEAATLRDVTSRSSGAVLIRGLKQQTDGSVEAQQKQMTASGAPLWPTDAQMAALDQFIYEDMGSPSDWLGFDRDGARRALVGAADVVTQSAFPGPDSGVINDACWKFVEALPHELPGQIFNDIKPALHTAITAHYSAAELAKLIEYANRISATDTRSPALTMLKRRAA